MELARRKKKANPNFREENKNEGSIWVGKMTEEGEATPDPSKREINQK